VLTDFGSSLASKGSGTVCGLKLVPLAATTPGPAEVTKGDDIVDEALAYLRTGTHHRKWVLDASSEATLVYLLRFLGSCFQALASVANAGEGSLVIKRLAFEPVALPGERGFPADGVMEVPESRAAADLCRSWLAQARAECGLRLLKVYFTDKGGVSAYWREVGARSTKFRTLFGTYSAPIEEEAAYKRNTTSSRSIEFRMPQDPPAAR